MEIFDPNTEALVLGAALTSQQNLGIVCDDVTPDLFENKAHRDLFIALYELYVRDVEATPAAAFNMAKELTIPLEMSFILSLTYATTGEEDLPYFIRQLKKMKRNRLYVNTLKKASTALDSATDSEEEISKLFDDLESFMDGGVARTQSLAQVFKENFKGTDLSVQAYLKQRLDDHANGITRLTGISTGFKSLDNVTDGLQKAWLYVFGARPSEGKTQFLLNILHNVAEKKVPCLFFSLELPSDDVAFELATIHSRTSHKELLNGTADPFDYDKVMKAFDEMQDWPLFIDDQPSLDTNQIRIRIKKAIRAHDIQVVFIDYLQELKAPTRHANHQEAMQVVSRSLREMAKEFKIPIVCSAQVNRESEKADTPKPPLASHLRESGQIEQCAWFIGVLHRPDKTDPYNEPGVLSLYVRKNRFGLRPKIKFSHTPDSPSYSYRIEELGDINDF